MKTTLDLPEDLVNEAMKVTGIKTKTQVVITALEELIRKATISELKGFKGRWTLHGPRHPEKPLRAVPVGSRFLSHL